jgi:hypothetical protein
MSVEKITLKYQNNQTTIYHEAAHVLEYRFGIMEEDKD